MLGRRQVEGLARNRIRLLLELHDALAQAVALRGQGGRVNQHAIAFDAVQRLAAVDFQLVHKAQLVVGLQEGPQALVHGQGEVRIFTGIVRRFGHVHLGERNLVHTLTAQVFKGQAFATQVPIGQALQAMRFVHLQHIALQHGVVHIALHLDAMVGKHMAVVLHMLAQLVFGGVFQPRFELGQHFIQGQLRGRIGGVVAQGDVSGLA